MLKKVQGRGSTVKAALRCVAVLRVTSAPRFDAQSRRDAWHSVSLEPFPFFIMPNCECADVCSNALVTDKSVGAESLVR